MRVFLTLLSYDHGILRQVLDVLVDIAERDTWDVHRETLPEVVDFLDQFMDRYHHGKEEQYLFPTAVRGSESLQAFIPDLIGDHRQAKAFTDAFGRSLEEWDTDGLRDTVTDLAAHMREHIKEEEDLAFPEFENVLDPDLDLQIYEEAQKYMEDNFSLSFQNEMEKFAKRLQDQVMGVGVIKYGPAGR